MGAALQHGRIAWDRGGDAYRTSTRIGAGAALAAGAGTAAIVRRSLGAEVDADTAEVQTRQYGGLSKAQARDLRDKWAAPLAEQLGVSTSKLLTSWTDAVKLGVPAEGAKAFARLATQTSEAWSMPFEAVSDVFGTINTLLTSQGEKFDIGRIKSVANTLQHLAAKQSTTPEKLVEFLRQGAGASQILGMSQEAGLAFGSASTSLGNRPGESGRLFDYIASRIIELPRLTKKHGDEGKQARELVKSLGYASASEIDASRRNSPDEFLPDLIERFNKILDPKRKDSALRFFAGREWLGELGRITSGIETYKEAAKLQREAKKLDAIGDIWQLHQEKLAFVGKQFKAGWLNILGELGKELTPLARQVGDYFLGWTAKLRDGGLAARFRTAIQGLIEGLGFRDLRGMLEGVFGKPGEGSAGSIKSWGEAAKGFGQGLRDVGNTILSFFRVFTGKDPTPETIGRWTARILGFSAALVVATPAIALLGALGTAIGAFAAVVAGAAAAMKAAGLMGGALSGAKVAGVGAGASASAGIVGSLGGLLSRLVPAIAAPLTLGPSREDQDRLMRKLGEGARERLRQDNKVREWSDPPARIQRQSLDGSQLEGLIRPASLRESDLVRGVDRLAEGVERLGARLQFAALSAGGAGLSHAILGGHGGGGSGGSGGVGSGGGAAGGTPRALYGATPGQPLPGTGFGRRGIIGGSGSGDGGVTPPMLKGEAAANAKNAYDFFRSKGLSHEAASGILASMKQESEFNPRARGDGGLAHGLFQHHPDRRAAILRGTGIDMSKAGVKEQLEGAWWEMNHGDAGAQRALRILRRPGISAREAGGAFVQHFERPKRDERAHRGALAEGFARQFGGGSVPGDVAPGDGGPGNKASGGVHPLDGRGRLTSDFGMRRHPLKGIMRMHNGIDLAAPAGTAVKAMRAGVASVGRFGDVSIKHDDGSSTTYRHIAAGIEAGARVLEGQMIGRLRAQDPRSTGPHLHLEAKDKAGRFIDPKGLLTPERIGAALGGNLRGEIRPGPTSPGFGPGIVDSVARAVEDIAEGFKSTGWQKRNAFGGVDPLKNEARTLERRFGPERVKDTLAGNYLRTLEQRGSDPKGPGTLADLVDRMPPAEAMARRAPMPPMGGGGHGGSSITAPITIQNNGDAEHTANQVQRRLMDATNYRTHDIGFESV